jgi:KaiC/GvpD/RAD55 family RecA-like ATPase
LKSVKVDFGGEYKDFPLGISILLYGPVASGKTTFSMTLVREMLKNFLPVIWICLDESPLAVREKMAYLNLDYLGAQEKNILRFIDLYSEQITGKPLQDPYVINCSSAFNLNEINRSLMRALSEVTGQGIVVFDSVSTLLLYNRSSSSSEFLKVHMSKITSSGFSGFFILQKDLHDQKTDETMKMMCDAVLDFGFDKDSRRIGVLKLPLGSSGDWIGSNLFAWQQPQEITISKAPTPKKYLDSGGYLEEFKEQIVEGIKEGIEKSQIAAPPQMMSPQVPEQIRQEMMKVLNEQARLSNAIQATEERVVQSRRTLDVLNNRENQAVGEFREIDEQTQALSKAISAKKEQLASLEAAKRMEDGKVAEAMGKYREIKAKVDSIIERKKNIENKLQDLMEGAGGDVNLNIAQYLKDALGRQEAVVEKCRRASEAFDGRMSTLQSEIKHLQEEQVQVGRKSRDKRMELEEVRSKRVQIESELDLVAKAREETESKLTGIVDQKKLLEQKINELTGGDNP